MDKEVAVKNTESCVYGWWCWCLKEKAPHYHVYFTDGSSKIIYPAVRTIEQ